MLRAQAHHPPLSSPLLVGVQPLESKMDNLRAKTGFHQDMVDCGIFCLTGTWLNPQATSKSFSVLLVDRAEESSTSKSGGVFLMTNN